MSFENECDWRLENLYKESHIWLTQVATNTTKNSENAADMVSDLYLYLHKHRKKAIFWGKSYNLMYCMRYIQSRWISKRDKLNRYKFKEDMMTYDTEMEEYDVEKDIAVMREYDKVLEELNRLSKTKHFPQAKLYELYWLSDDNNNIMDIANKIHLSKSTVFTAIKKIRLHLRTIVENPFNE
jgi:DNA-directed RNA polymerase specialized sigma24 family protein